MCYHTNTGTNKNGARATGAVALCQHILFHTSRRSGLQLCAAARRAGRAALIYVHYVKIRRGRGARSCAAARVWMAVPATHARGAAQRRGVAVTVVATAAR